MGLRLQREEADKNKDEQTEVCAEGEDRQRSVQGRNVHGVADAQREDGAPRANVGPGEEVGARRRKRR